MSEEEAMPTENLPDVLITDILSMLPVKSLLRFRCVCKTWCALIDDPAFIKLHLNRSIANSSYLSLILTPSYLYSVDLDACEHQTEVELDPPIKSPSYGTLIVGSCNGLLCIYNYEDDIILWNPSIRRHQKLPITPIEFPPRFHVPHIIHVPRIIAYGLGYDPTTDDYKVVRVVQFYGDDEYSFDSEVKVYSLSTNSWRRIKDMPYEISGFGILANSALHWLVARGPDMFSNFIVSFDLKDEEYRELPLPDSVYDEFHMNVEVLGGQLCLLCNFGRVRVEVWMMKDYGVRNSWVKQFSIEQPTLIRSLEYFRPICYTKNGEVRFDNIDTGALVFYDPSSGRARNLRILGVPGYVDTGICVGSLVPLSAKDGTEQPEKKKKHRKQKKKKNRGQRETERLTCYGLIEDFTLTRVD